jgi:hypothetical protein
VDDQRARHLPQRAQRERVVDAIAHDRAVRVRRELVTVVPQPVRAPDLAIDERRARLPLLDPRRPAQREAVQAQAVLDQRAGAHGHRLGREDLEAQPRRRDRLQVAGAGEEREHFLARAPHDLCTLEAMRSHAASTSRRAGSSRGWRNA